MKMLRDSLVLLCLLVLGFSATCRAQPANPEDVLKAFYRAANAGKYEEAKQYLSAEAIRHAEGSLGALAGGWKGIMDRYTRNGTLEKVEVYDLSMRGDGASCRVKKHFKDKSIQELPVEFIKEQGKWKIAWSTPTL